MTEQIRPKISAIIKQIAASDSTGASKSRVDTKAEYKSLWTYYNEHKNDLNSAETSTFERLLEKAKQLLHARGENVEEQTDTDSTNDDYDDQMESKETEEPNAERNATEISSTDDNYDDQMDPKEPSAQETKKTDTGSTDDDYDEAKKTQQTDDPNAQKTEKTDTDSTTQDGTSRKMPGKKVVVEGKICIKMPNGDLYDAASGRKLK